MNMKPKTFLILTSTMVLVGLASYLYLVDSRVMAPRAVPMFYPQYLLEASAGIKGKVIVESGSNSQHGIEPAILAAYFKGPVIIVAQNAGFPLLPRIYNLAQYVETGDVVILPLEWNIYVDNEVLTSDFLKAVSRPQASMTHYYQNLPIAEKVRFLLHQLPLSYVIDSALAPVNPRMENREIQDKLSYYHQRLNSIDKTAFGGSHGRKVDSHQINQGCDSYILGNQIFSTGFTVSSEFSRALASIRRLTERGAHVYFTWPAVADSVDSVCYQNKSLLPAIENYAKHIRSVVEDAGYQFVGDFRDSRFPADCIADTHYHITNACAIDRTRHLVEQLYQIGAKPTNSETTPEQLLEIARERLGIVSSTILAQMEQLLPQVKRVPAKDFDSELMLSDGWARPEKWGVWSNGPQSSLSLRVASELLASGSFEIRLRGKYFNGSEATGVTINGRDFGQHVLADKKFTVMSELLDKGILRLNLDHHNPISPYQLGLSDDERNLKYGLTEIELLEVLHH
jgi:hypothetical protein